MKLKTICKLSFAFVTSFIFLGINFAYGADLECDEDGPVAIVVNEQRLEFGDEALPSVSRVRITDQFRDKRAEARAALELEGPEEAPYIDGREFEDADTELLEQDFDPDDRRLRQSYQWGSVRLDYTTQENRLDIDVHVENDSDSVIESLSINIPAPVLGDGADYEGSACNNIGSPTVREASNDEVKVVLGNRQAVKPLRLQWRQEDGEFSIALRGGHPEGGREVYDGVWDVRPIDRGESDTYRISLIFGEADADKIELAEDIYTAFRETHPPILQWNDHRPIGSLYLADYHDKTPENPRRYTAGGFPEDGDVHTEAGRESLRRCLLNYADRVVDTARSMGLQGVIVWDLEGTEYPHPITYLGAPRLLKYMAPEMDAVADDFFERLDEAGLRHGLTIRPTLLRPFDEEGNITGDWDKHETVSHGPWLSQNMYERVYSDLDGFTPEEMHSPLERLSNKIAYAKDRWGCTLFYVDTPHLWRPRERTDGLEDWESKHLGAEVFEELARRHPDVVIIPEHSYPQYRASTAPYYQIGYSPWITPRETRAIYPETFVFQNISNAPDTVEDNPEVFIRGIRKGDSFLVHGWFGGQVRQTRQVFSVAAALAPYKVNIQNDGIRVNDLQLENPADLKEYFKEELHENMPFTRRRVFVSYEDALDYAEEVKAVMKLIAQTDAVVAWAQPRSAEGFWNPYNPFQTRDEFTEAFLKPGSESEEGNGLVFLAANADADERVVEIEIDYGKLGLGVSGPRDVVITSLDTLTPDATDLPEAPDIATEPEEGDGMVDDLIEEIKVDTALMGQDREDFEFKDDNYWLDEESLEVLVAPESYRILHIRSR